MGIWVLKQNDTIWAICTTSFKLCLRREFGPAKRFWIHSTPLALKGTLILSPHNFTSLLFLQIKDFLSLFEILQKRDPSEVGNMARMEMYSINTRDPKGVKIRKQAARDGVQFNFVPPEGVPSSCTSLGNTGESIVVGPERTDQFSPKSNALPKPSEGLSPIGVKKDGLIYLCVILEVKGWCLVRPMLFLQNPTPPKGPPPVKKSHEAVPNNFKVPSSTTKGSAVQRSFSVGPVQA